MMSSVRHTMNKKTIWLSTLSIAAMLLIGCTTPEMEYRHVLILDTGPGFHFVDPREATVWLAESKLDSEGTFSVYLYEVNDQIPFNDMSFFSYLGDHVIYSDPDTDELYTREKTSIKDDIEQYYIDKEMFEGACI